MEMTRTIDVTVSEGGEVMERRACITCEMPDGSPGVLWRGVPYRLLDGERIDVEVAPEPEEPASGATLLREGDMTWVLVRGLAASRLAMERRLAASGARISRSGRWLGENVRGVAYDWFIRCEGDVEITGPTAPVAEPDAEARVAILETRLLEVRADLARLAERLAAPPAPADPARTAPPRTEDPRLGEALSEIAALRARLAEAPTAPTARSVLRLEEELGAALAAFRPDVRLLRDSLRVATAEFTSRAGFLRTIRELPAGGGRPDGWKAVRGTPGWWERHVATGFSDAGRAYARFSAAARNWALLLGLKGEQTQDIEWLRRRGEDLTS